MHFGLILPGSAGVVIGNCSFDGGGDANAIFVFKIGGALPVMIANILLAGTAYWKNVFAFVDGIVNLSRINTSILKGIFIGRDAKIYRLMLLFRADFYLPRTISLRSRTIFC